MIMQETVTTLSGSHTKDTEVEGKLLREKPFCVGGKKREGGGMIKIQFTYMKLLKV